MDRFRPLVAEFIGTFTLVFVGGGAICMDAASGGKVTLLGIAVAHGLALGLMVSNFAHISGGRCSIGWRNASARSSRRFS
jgi:glycerol uptake facilitator-like aquaporin